MISREQFNDFKLKMMAMWIEKCGYLTSDQKKQLDFIIDEAVMETTQIIGLERLKEVKDRQYNLFEGLDEMVRKQKEGK